MVQGRLGTKRGHQDAIVVILSRQSTIVEEQVASKMYRRGLLGPSRYVHGGLTSLDIVEPLLSPFLSRARV